MINNITKISDFGVFQSFSGASLPECKKMNLIYGWNYSGKTTLSRVFRCLEQQSVHPDYANAKFTLQSSPHVYDETFAAICNIRVFNEDFKRDNLRWDDAQGLDPIFILGSKNIALQATLDAKMKEFLAATDAQRIAKEKSTKAGETLGGAQTQCAITISRELGIVKFDKRHLKPNIDKLIFPLPPQIDQTTFDALRLRASNSDTKPNVEPINFKPVSLNVLLLNINELLQRKVPSAGLIQALLDNKTVSDWVEAGQHLHSPGVSCAFCGGKLTDERIAQIQSHFSKDLVTLKQDIRTVLEEIEKARPSCRMADYGETKFYSDLHPRWKTGYDKVATEHKIFDENLDKAASILKEKLDNPFLPDSSLDFIDNQKAFQDAINEFNSLIDDTNTRTARFGAMKTEAIENLKDYYTLEYAIQNNHFGVTADIAALNADVQKQQSIIAALEPEILDLQRQLSDSIKGSETINDILIQFFGKDDIRIVVTPEDTFALMRGTERAKNLSEGEKTAIAFAYFVTKLSENSNVLADTLVYIDDPISSLDSHHLFNIYAFIRSTFYRFDAAANPKHQLLCKQLFISTHNFEFFYLIHDWFKKAKEDDFEVFMIERTASGPSPKSTIKACGEELTKYNSEYLYLFNTVKNYKNTPSTDADIIFNLGNILRRFVEGYLHFKFLTHTNIEQHLTELIVNPVDLERARKFMHFHSHTLSRAGARHVADMTEAKAVVDIVLDAIAAQDPLHFNALMTSS